MGVRRKARESALQILFQLEFDDSPPEDVLANYWVRRKPEKEVREYGAWLVSGFLRRQDEIDGVIDSISDNWRLSRMAVVDRNILRIAIFEFLEEKHIAAAVIINEALEIAKKYSGEQAGVFINGILDAAQKKVMKDSKNTDKEQTDDGQSENE
jgi:transcription antitermination protein NusB